MPVTHPYPLRQPPFVPESHFSSALRMDFRYAPREPARTPSVRPDLPGVIEESTNEFLGRFYPHIATFGTAAQNLDLLPLDPRSDLYGQRWLPFCTKSHSQEVLP